MKTKLIPLTVAALALYTVNSFAQSIKPNRIGPVSQYGQLITGKNSASEGRIYGSCKGVAEGSEVQVRGMSLYWSLLAAATDFWTETGVTSMVNDMNIQIVRAAMATGTENWGGPYKGYQLDATNQKNLVSAVVEAAIKNDIYVIIDWHSHEATGQVESAKSFFSEMAQKYGSYDNVIFEIFNEPQDIAWENIKNYANQIIPAIRAHSDNLILVGTRAWDQHPEEVIGNEVTDSKNNTAYTLHYYAMSHCVSGSYSWGGSCEGANGEKAIKAGLSVFISEWGTGTADGGGTPGQAKNDEWQAFANKYKISWANWSASRINEGTAAFTEGSIANNLQYSASGNLVKSYLATNPTSYTACSTEIPDTSSTGIAKSFRLPSLELKMTKQAVQLVNAKNPSIHLYDLQGHSLKSSRTSSLSLENLPNGTYIVKASDGRQNQMQSIRITR